MYLQVVECTLGVALYVEVVEEEGDRVVLWSSEDDGAVDVVWVDVRPARTLQITVFLFISSAAT